MEVKRIDEASAAKILGAVWAGFGVPFGFYIAFAGLTHAPRGLIGGALGLYPALRGALTALLTAVAVPVLQGLLGLFAGGLAAWLYNLAARHLGGLEVEVE